MIVAVALAVTLTVAAWAAGLRSRAMPTMRTVMTTQAVITRAHTTMMCRRCRRATLTSRRESARDADSDGAGAASGDRSAGSTTGGGTPVPVREAAARMAAGEAVVFGGYRGGDDVVLPLSLGVVRKFISS